MINIKKSSKTRIVEKIKKQPQLKLIQPEDRFSGELSLSQIAQEINNQTNHILGNSQLIMDIWKDMEKILQKHKEEYKHNYLGGLSFNSLNEIVPQVLYDTIKGSIKISKITRILEYLNTEREGNRRIRF